MVEIIASSDLEYIIGHSKPQRAQAARSMLDPYRMIVVNLIASAFLFAGIIFYKFIFPKKKINLFLLLLLISILPVISILRVGAYESGDFTIHVYRSMAFYDALRDGQIIPSWPKDLNGTYGYPLFIFNYNFPYYITSLFHFIGLSFIASMKLFLILAYVLSGIFMFLWSKNEFKNSLAAFTASIFYLFTPYHLVDFHFRVSIGEITVFALLPLLFFYIQKFLTNYKKITLLYISLIFSLIMLSHAGTGFFSLTIIIPYIFYHSYFRKIAKRKINNHQLLISLSASLLFGILISSYIFLSYLLFAKYTYANLLTSSSVSLVPIRELLFSQWRMGFLFQGPKGELSFLIGYTQIFILFFVSLLSFKKFYNRLKINPEIIWILTAFLLIFLVSPFSYQIWKTFLFLNVIQFSYRLLLLLTICISMLAGYYALYYSKKAWLVYFLLILTIGYTMLNWGHRTVIPTIDDNVLRNNLPKSTIEGEGFCCAGSTIWTDIKNPWIGKVPQKHLEITKGEAEWKDVSRTSVKHEYVLLAKTPITVQENTLYFPGWSVKDNQNKLKIYYSIDSPKGVIKFNLSPGLHFIQVEYKDIPLFWLSKLINILGIFIIMIVIMIYKAKHFFHEKYP